MRRGVPMNALGSRNLGWVLGCLIAATVMAAPVPAPSTVPATPTRIRVVADNNFPPYLFLDRDGKPQGYVVDMWRLFQAHTGIRVELEPMSWTDARQALHDGRADVLDMIYQSPARNALYDFSRPYATNPIVVFVARDVRGVHDPASLRGLRVGVEQGDVCTSELAAAGITDLAVFPDYSDIVQAAAQGSLRAFCMGQNPANFMLFKYAMRDRFKQAFVLRNEQLYRVVRKGDATMLRTVDRGMALITPAERKALQARWLTDTGTSNESLRIAGIVLAAALALFALMMLWVWSLRRTVARRTRDLQAGEAKLRALFDASPDEMTVKDSQGVYIDCNENAVKRLQIKRDEIIGHTVSDLFGPEISEPVQAMDEEVLRHGQSRTYQDPFIARHGDKLHYYETIKVPLRASKDRVDGILSITRDITERRQAEIELRLAAAAFDTQEAMMVTDVDAVIQRANDAAVRLTGYAAEELVGQPTTMLRSRQHDEAFYRQVREHIRAHGMWQGELWMQGKQGEPRAVRLMVSRVTNAEGEITHYVSSMVDLTSERIARASIDHMTFFDPVTDLPNRFFLHGRLQHLLDAATQPNGGALLMVDLDHFKRINDLHGHAAGDRLLSLVAQRLRCQLDDRCTLCRFSGGTFALVEGCHPDSRDTLPESAWACAKHIRLALRQPFQIGDEPPIMLTVSIGWTKLVPGHGSPDSVLKEAELALYSAKAAGRDKVHQFDPAMQTDLLRREALIRDLRTAIADESLSLHLQPQADRAGHIVGAEALLRWTRPDGEPVSPSVFIPIAEEGGLILPIGHWVLERACKLLAEWSRKPATRNLSLAVNVSARQFAETDFVQGVDKILTTTGADPARLKLEITETAILGDLDEISGKLAQLRRRGIEVALDDFGIGYSSLTYLSRLPLDQLKIDQSFVARLPDTNNAMVAQTIVAMGHGLGMQVVAEGVETQAQMDFLMAHGCDVFQGYLIARPMPEPAFQALLETHATSA